MKKLLFLILFLIPISVDADSSHSTVVMDIPSNRIIYSKNMDEKQLIASTTKIMTCIIVLENTNIKKEITIGEEVLKSYGTNIYISPGEKITIEDLLYGLMLRSGNDAAMSLAINTFENEEKFIEKMNDKAKEIGMKSTTFKNPHGLDDKTYNYSTAYDMAILGSYAYKNEMYRKIISTKKYKCKSNKKSYLWYNRVSILNNYKYSLGGKNGYTPKAGKSLVSYASKNNTTLMIVTLDDPDIYENHKKIYNRYFPKYKNYLILDKNKFLRNTNIVKEKVYIKKSFSYPLLEEEKDNITTLVEIFKESQNNIIGRVIINLNNNEIGRRDIYILKNKKEDTNIFQKIKNLFIR